MVFGKKGCSLTILKGDSKKQNYLTYKLKANFSYKFSAAHSIDANIIYMQDAPAFQASFVSPRTRNSATPGISSEKVFGVDASYNLRWGMLKHVSPDTIRSLWISPKFSLIMMT